MERVEVYSEGLCYMSVCAESSMTPAQVEEYIRIRRVAGTSNGWKLSPDKTFKSGQPNPCPCDVQENRTHYLLEC